MYNLYFLIGYNNYYNRKPKKHNSIAEYILAVGGITNCQKIENCINFTPGDGIQTTQLVPLENTLAAKEPDYLVVCDRYNNIIQRWYVVDCERTRAGQYVAKLYRDVVVDAWNELVDSPVFIEKAILNPSDKAIFNHENMTFSQIKKKEDKLLSDRSGCPWIVGYGDFSKLTSTTGNVTFGATASNIKASRTVSGIVNDKYYNAPSVTSYDGYETITLRYNHHVPKTGSVTEMNLVEGFVYNGTNTTEKRLYADVTKYNEFLGKTYLYDGLLTPGQQNPKILNQITNQFIGCERELDQAIVDLNPTARNKIATYMSQDGTIVKDSLTNKFYRISVITQHISVDDTEINTGTDMFRALEGVGKNTDLTGSAGSKTFSIGLYRSVTTIKYVNISKGEATINLAGVPQLSDAPYSMFFMPYASEFSTFVEGNYYKQNKENTLECATGIATAMAGAGVSMDIQILPYCPIQDERLAYSSAAKGMCLFANKLTYRNATDANGNIIATVCFADYSSGQFTINNIISTNDREKKVKYETTLYRLCSPNYDSVYEFSPQMNNNVSSFDIQFTYKPYTPYIHIAPTFNSNSMYGLNQPGDQRGLICNGNFSITQMTDVWATYQLQNINYQNAFDREIQTQELRNKFAMANDIVSSIAGTVQGTAQGAITGSLGGPWGAVAGAVAGGVTSAVGGVADVVHNKILRDDELDLRKDQFGYSLGNIQARPNTIGKLTGFNILSRYIPFLEYYEAPDEEVNALIDKIVYNGMTVMRIGTISQYLNNEFYRSINSSAEPYNFIQGKLIRCEVKGEGFHFVNALASEVAKGLYISIGGL